MLGIKIERKSEVSLRRQIYNSLKDGIIKGLLKAGETLPSTRELAKALGVSRNTICEAYDMLIAEGFIISRQGALTRVTEGLCLEPEHARLSTEKADIKHKWRIDFSTGQPDLNSYPLFTFKKMLNEAVLKLPLSCLGYTGPQGLPELRQEVASWLFRSRGLKVDAQDIFITAGATHALHIVATLLKSKAGSIQIEDPCHRGMLKTFINEGFEIIPVPVDAQGILTDCLKKDAPSSVYVTPSHQFPLGGILPAQRRASLIRYARKYSCYIIEDDYDSEFRYIGDPVAPLYSMDPQHVIYVNTFSKVLYPALRIGYVILPSSFHKRWKSLRTHTDVQNPLFEQAALTEFMQTRKMDRHIQRMRRVYRQRRQVLLDSLTQVFGGAWRPWGDSAGLHLAVEFNNRYFDDAFIKKTASLGIRISTVEMHCIEKGNHRDKLLLGYGHLEPNEIKKGVEYLKELII